MNIFENVKIYPDKWEVTDVRNFTVEEIAAVASAEVVQGDFGLSVCFTMINGGKAYIGLDGNSSYSIGDKVDVKSAQLLTLSKKGEGDIQRVKP